MRLSKARRSAYHPDSSGGDRQRCGQVLPQRGLLPDEAFLAGEVTAKAVAGQPRYDRDLLDRRCFEALLHEQVQGVARLRAARGVGVPLTSTLSNCSAVARDERAVEDLAAMRLRVVEQ